MVLEPTTPKLILALAASTLCSLSGCSATSDESPIELGQVQQAVCVGPSDGSIAVYVSPEGNDAAAGTCNAPLATLEGANRWLRARYGYDTIRSSSGDYSDDCQLFDWHTIYVRGGTYAGQFVNWDCTSPGNITRIIAYPGERPIFDGLGSQRYAFLVDKPEDTNIELNGITWRHYVSFVIQFRGDYAVAKNKTAAEIARVTEIRDAGANGRNKVINNVFEENGDLYRTSCNYKEKPCVGFGVIDTFNSDHNTYSYNVFYRSENREDASLYPLAGHSKHMMHALYLAMDSDSNFVGDNYIALTSGAPVKLRDGADDNTIKGNYMTDSGSTAFVTCASGQDVEDQVIELPCQNNRVTNNSFTFGYPWPDTYSTSTRVKTPVPALSVSVDDYLGFDDPVFTEQLTVIHNGERQPKESVGAVAVGDLRDIGTEQVVVALNYPGLHKIVATPGDGTRYLSRLLYVRADDWSIDALAIGAFDSTGEQQLISAFNQPGKAELWRGDGEGRLLVQGSSSAKNLDPGPLYSNDNWTITALAAGDFDENGRDELVSGFKSAGGTTRIYRGNGRDTIGSSIYESTYWDVSATTAADLDADGDDELVTAFLHRSSGENELRIYSGNGLTSATSGGYVYSSTALDVTALAAGYPGSSSSPRPQTPTLFTAFRRLDGSGYREVYAGSVASPRATRLYRSTGWDIVALATGELDPNLHDTLLTAFEWPSRTQIHAGNGTSSATGLGIYHRFDTVQP